MGTRARVTLGIDGGGSGCRVALRLPGGGVLRGEGGPANAFSDPERAGVEITGTVGAALDRAGLDWATLKRARIVAGIAGCRLPDLAAEMARRLPFPAQIVDDSVTTLEGALGPRDGTVASLGTGSFYVRRSGADIRHLGGWGFRLGDEASAAWLGRKAVTLSLQAVEGRRPADRLSDAVMAALPPHPLIALKEAPPAKFAKLTPLVFEHLDTGLGATLLAMTLDEVTATLTDIGHKPGEPLVLMGGFGRVLTNHLPNQLAADVTEPAGTPLDGALALAAALP